MFNKKRKGFSLLELVLVLGVGASLTFIKFQDMIQDQNDLLAKGAGEQIKQLGDAVNGYINIRYDKLSTLASSTSQSSDPGPRTCNTGNNTCTITTATLVNEGLLHSSYSGKNVYQSGYNIVLKRSGTAPNYVIDGLISTTNPLTLGASTIKYDLLGKAMQVAGIDSGMTKSATQTDGYNGMWKETNANFSNINQAGLLTYRTGYNAALYSIYLRRDGTLPMTGNLNMGANDINNAKNITASGTGTFGGNVIAGGEVVAHNGVGDVITLGGDAAGGAAADYELRLGSNKQLSIYSPKATQYSTVLSVNRNSVFGERISTNGLNPNDVPSTWGGGLRTLDVLSSGSVAVVKSGSAGSTGNWAAYLTNNGNVYASNNVTSAGTINASGRITGGDIYSNSETYTNNWFRTMGDGGIYFQKYGGGWNMTNTSTITAYGGKNIQTTAGLYGGYVKSTGNIDASGNITGNYVRSNGQILSSGRLTTNEFVQINGQAGEGAGCSPNGLVGRTAAGKLLSCTSGKWTAAAVGTPGYYCRLTSFDKGRSDDYVGYTPRTDQNCPVIRPGQAPNGFCSCIKVVLDY